VAEKAGLYVHVPFCTSVCPYCDFAVLIAGELRRGDYLHGVNQEACRHADRGLRFDTVYLGGGTPSSLDPEDLARLLEDLSRNLRIEPEAQFFLETNPEDVDVESAAAWRRLGFSFVSVGVQSFDDRGLAALGRRHSGEHAVRAVRSLQEAGFDTVSIDLIYALPGQSAGLWRRQLETAVALEVDHLSCYQLTVHAGTVFGKRRDRGELRETGVEAQAELFLLTHSLLADAGYPAYEVSSFARFRRHRSAHNRKYWQHTPYIGLGPSAHSFVGRRRWWNRRKLRMWQRSLAQGRDPLDGEELLSDRQMLLEAVMLGLRRPDGIDLVELGQRFDVDLQGLNSELLARLEETGEIRLEGSRAMPTRDGLAVADGLARLIRISE